MNAFEYVSARSYDAATTFLAGGASPRDTLVKSGGIDVVDRLKERLDTPRTVLNLRGLTPRGPLIELREADGVLAIHALATMHQVAQHPEIGKRVPALARACDEAATPQIRHVATIGGNLCQRPRCWYYRSHDFPCLKKGGSTCYAVEGDNRFHAILGASACHIVHPSNAAVPLVASNASLRLVRSDDGKLAERVVPLSEFFRVPTSPQDDEHTLEFGELIREILIPLASTGPRSAYLEVREKLSFDWPVVACAANLNNAAEPRVVLGAVAPIPWRLPEVESLIAGKELDDALLVRAGRVAVRKARPMSNNGYKLAMASAVVADALRAAAR